MMAILFCKYQDNLDSSQVEMKRFNESPTGRYPSFTFCIYAKEGLLFKKNVLENQFGLSQKNYYDLLSGKIQDIHSRVNQINFDHVVIGIDDFLEEFEAQNDAYEAYNAWTPSMDIPNSPFVSSYQDPTTNCYTYNTQYDKKLSLNALKIKFNITKFLDFLGKNGKIYIQAHYPGQMIRDMKTFLLKVSNWKTLSSKNGNNHISIQFQGVTLMRFRENAVDPCHSAHHEDDDSEWKEYVTQKIGCTPSYWNKNYEKPLQIENNTICNNVNTLKFLKSYWPMDGGIHTNEVFRNFTKPCSKMILFNNLNYVAYEKSPDVLKVKFRFREEFYQEILNSRGFGMDDLWASVGGYVGIFCGYSVLQVATYLITKIRVLIETGLDRITSKR